MVNVVEHKEEKVVVVTKVVEHKEVKVVMVTKVVVTKVVAMKWMVMMTMG